MVDYRPMFRKVLFEMQMNIIDRRIMRGTIQCSSCETQSQVDCFECCAPLEQSCHTFQRNDWLNCNHYLCKLCILGLIETQNECYFCPYCEQDITWWINIKTDFYQQYTDCESSDLASDASTEMYTDDSD